MDSETVIKAILTIAILVLMTTSFAGILYAVAYYSIRDNYVRVVEFSATQCEENNKTILIVPHPDVVARICKNAGYETGVLSSVICTQNQVLCSRLIGNNSVYFSCVSVITGESIKARSGVWQP